MSVCVSRLYKFKGWLYHYLKLYLESYDLEEVQSVPQKTTQINIRNDACLLSAVHFTCGHDATRSLPASRTVRHRIIGIVHLWMCSDICENSTHVCICICE